MRSDLFVMLLVTASVAAAGCFGDSGSTGDPVDDECENKFYRFEITSTPDATHPIYRLNELDEDGNVRMVSVVAMGFQLGGADPRPSDESPGLEVPNPEIRLKECDSLELTISNTNPLAHTFHLHGGLDKWTMDGVPYLSQLPVMSHLADGAEFTYVFENLKAGTYWYHCHVDVAHHIDLGMYGAFIVEEREPTHEYDGEFVMLLDEWDTCHVHGGLNAQSAADNNRENTGYPAGDIDCEGRTYQDYFSQGPLQGNNQAACDQIAQLPDSPQKDELERQFSCGHGNPSPGRDARHWYYTDFPPYTPHYNAYTINGKSFPDTLPMYFETGKSYKIRLINVGEEMHSMHLHGHSFLITHRDGYEDPSPQRADTIGIMPGERYDILVTADNPGFWAFHDHVGLNVANDYQSPGGMFTLIAYVDDEFRNSVTVNGEPFDPATIEHAIDIMDFTKAYHEEHGTGHDHGFARNVKATPLSWERNDQGQIVLS